MSVSPECESNTCCRHTQPELQVHHFSWGSPKEISDPLPHGQAAAALGLVIRVFSKVPSTGFWRVKFLSCSVYPRRDFYTLTLELNETPLWQCHGTRNPVLEVTGSFPEKSHVLEDEGEEKQSRDAN